MTGKSSPSRRSGGSAATGVQGLPAFTPPPPEPTRHRDLLFEATGVDTDTLVHPLLIRFCGAFLDQGLADWSLPRRSEGFYRAFCALYRQPWGPPDRWMRGLAGSWGGWRTRGSARWNRSANRLTILGVPPAEWESYLAATLLALRGWAGMVRQIEIRGDRVVQPVPEGSLVEFLAVRLVLDRFALAFAVRQHPEYDVPLNVSAGR